MEETLAFPPWLDLPEPLAELVLERLPLVDYIRFAAVCPKWRSIQRGHRLRHSPHPPPMANQIPWLIPLRLNPHQEVEFYSPLDQRSYLLPIPGSLHNSRCLASCRGWLLLLEDDDEPTPTPTSKQTFLFNPVTAVHIPLPPLFLILWPRPFGAIGAMSAPPTDPNCVLLIVFDGCAFLHRPNDHPAADWTVVQLTPRQGVFGGSAIYWRGKFYYLESFFLSSTLYVIDPFLHKGASQLVMRGPMVPSADYNIVSLLEFGGELFLILPLYVSQAIEGFQLFKADLPGKEWVRVETLGDHALFHDSSCSVFLLAADVGCKRNTIYTCKELNGHAVFTWGVYDLGIMGWTEEETVMHGDFGPWFLPTLDPANPAKASDRFFTWPEQRLKLFALTWIAFALPGLPFSPYYSSPIQTLESLYPFLTLLPCIQEDVPMSELLPFQKNSTLASRIIKWTQQTINLKDMSQPAVIIKECLATYVKKQVDFIGNHILLKLMNDWRLMDELGVSRAIYLLGSGDLLQQFLMVIYDKMDRGDSWGDDFELNTLLQESIRNSADGTLLCAPDSLVQSPSLMLLMMRKTQPATVQLPAKP